uniref:EF-hand domain-containing protein n=1 Tax=Chromera velia CCMP2878 TaxID=1169474 RepID=A0A0G4FE07_9ALVE|eukprot:Cvel_16548.t1-p1 / transcript=Cvel_16548.t1 / gene=Cvel_16548 / organism=Chromera_velia_CCMP2878 / gene_product=hypothetical protein / transcript_product=hypothetical protein / location=Cvel_scaffold1279:33351-36383(+) / protein_length=589 / sequence_SO=supercontig / SO=protein_coding / is_pseudo=false
MGEVLGKLFIDPASLEGDYAFVQVLFLGAVYGYILFYASNLISSGSELLLLVPSLAGLVGSVVLPILGAVPDGAIVLFSGIGENAQEELKVGVGALAGSTIMLFTIPWFLSIMGGRVNIENGQCTYTKPAGAPVGWSKLSPPGNFSPWKTGVECEASIGVNAKIVMLTALSYLIIQLPAFYSSGVPEYVARDFQNGFALAGMIVTFLAFVAYLIYQARVASQSKVVEDRILETQKSAISSGKLNLRGVMYEVYKLSQRRAARDNRTGREAALVQQQQNHQKKLEELLRPFFLRLDMDNSGRLETHEIRRIFHVLGERPSPAELSAFFEKCDRDKSGAVDFNEFVSAMEDFVLQRSDVFAQEPSPEALEQGMSMESPPESPSRTVRGLAQQPESEAAAPTAAEPEGEEEDDETEEEEIPEDLAHLSPEQQQTRIKMRAFYQMGLGTALVLLFSDPMVSVMSNVGTRTGISSFYISFILAPLASNASEVIASYNYALKKTRKTITISFAALEGAASMNNTFCLFVFLTLIYIQKLTWQFSAETMAILLVEVIMSLVALRRVHRLGDGMLVLTLYPLSIFIVWALENWFGWD